MNHSNKIWSNICRRGDKAIILAHFKVIIDYYIASPILFELFEQCGIDYFENIMKNQKISENFRKYIFDKLWQALTAGVAIFMDIHSDLFKPISIRKFRFKVKRKMRENQNRIPPNTHLYYKILLYVEFNAAQYDCFIQFYYVNQTDNVKIFNFQDKMKRVLFFFTRWNVFGPF